MKLPAPHRIARLYYGPRVVSFGLAFLASAVLVAQGFVSHAALPFAVLLFLVYPHLVYLHACFAKRKKQAELNHLLLDAFLLGSWTAVIHFDVGLGFALLSAVSLNNTMVGGLPRLAKALGMFAAGMLVAGALNGFEFQPSASLTITVLGLLGVLIYMVIVALLFHQQNLRMLATMKENLEKRQLFESLAAAGLASANSESLEDLLDACVTHLHQVIEPGRGIGILVRDRSRADVVYCTAFRGFGDAEQALLLAQAHSMERSRAAAASALGEDGGVVHWSFIGPPTTSLESLFVIQGGDLAADEVAAVDIFLQQLAGSLENHALTMRLRELANTDPLTGLANRARLEDCLTKAIHRKRRSHGTDFSVIVADIDGLKALNDSRGHEAGDRLIIATANLLRASCRETDLVARAGGDEFVVICPATTTATAAHLIERLRRCMLQQSVQVDPADAQANGVRLHFSLGCADSSETAPTEVMKLADQRMYEAKAAYHERAQVL